MGIVCLFPVLFGRAAQVDIPAIADHEKIDPLRANAVDFLDADFARLLQLAKQHTGENRYYEAAQCYLALLKFNLDDAATIYSLACCYGQLGKADLAVKCLALAAKAGFRDFELLKSDRNFDSVRATPQFQNLLARIPLWEEVRGEVLYVKTGRLGVLRVSVPPRFEPDRRYPLLLGLHGYGGHSEQMLAALNQALKGEPVILAAAQGAYPGLSHLRGPHFSWEMETRDRTLWKVGDPLAVENLAEVIRVLQLKYRLGEIYILGFSQGATYAFLTAFKFPEPVTGVISIGGGFPEADTEYSILKEKEIEGGKKFRVFIAQGNDDRLIPAGYGARTAEKLKKYGYDVEFLEYRGGHEVSPELLKKIYAWMVKK